MPTPQHEPLREVIRRTLTQRAGAAADASAVANATLSSWQAMAARLSPVIGARGVDVLLRRALHLTSRDYVWLTLTPSGGDSAALLAGIQLRLAGREAPVAAAASEALLVAVTELLATLIGASLTARLLNPVWSPPAYELELPA
jgi:hypothetical protein